MAARVSGKREVALNSGRREPANFNIFYGNAFPEHLTGDAKCLGAAGRGGLSSWSALAYEQRFPSGLSRALVSP